MTGIKTDRLILRPLRIDDAEALVSLAGDIAVSRQTSRIPNPYTLEAAETWIASIADGAEVSYAIELDGALIGTIGHKPVDTGVVELGYWLGKEFWGRSYASEAARGLVEIIFYNPDIRTIIGTHAKDNPGSRRVIEKLGFQLIGDCVCYSLARDADVPCMRHQLHRDEYFRRKTT